MATEILSANLELRASERMTDAEDGGGEMSATVIQDNKINQVFGPISASDRITGRVSLRQAYLHINTATDDTYYGANVILDRPPSDPATDVVLFQLEEQGALRTAAKSAIESYVIMGPRSLMHPLGTQNPGQTQILAYQDLESPLPEIGDVYILSEEKLGYTQAFSITAITSAETQFAYFTLNDNNIHYFKAILLTLTISQPLQYVFAGDDPTPLTPGDSWIRRTAISDGARYAGISTLAEPITAGATAFSVDRTQAQLVPVTTIEKPILDIKALSLTSTVDVGDFSVDVTEKAFTDAVSVSLISRGLVYTKVMIPPPAPGMVRVHYRTGGRWYTLYDDGAGAITGDATEYGAGTVLYSSGAATVTLGDLPDIGSMVIWEWGVISQVTTTDFAEVIPYRSYYDLAEPVDPTTLTLTFLRNGLEKVATIAVATGFATISGEGVTGLLDSSKGLIYLEWTSPPDSGSTLGIAYHVNTIVTETVTLAADDITRTITLAAEPVPGTIRCAWECSPIYDAYKTTTNVDYSPMTAVDVANTLYLQPYGPFQAPATDAALIVGTVDYEASEISFTALSPVVPAVVTYPMVTIDGTTYHKTTANVSFTHGVTPLTIQYLDANAAPASTERTFSVPMPPPVFSFRKSTTGNTLVPGGLRFRWGGQEYRDLGQGSIYRHAVPWLDGVAGTYAGAVDYDLCTATLTDYVTTTASLSNVTCCMRAWRWAVGAMYGRVPSAPIRPGSFYVRATTAAGDQIDATADIEGLIGGGLGVLGTGLIRGELNHTMGTYQLRFGQYKLWMHLTDEEKAQPWASMDYLVQGHLWVPISVEPDTIRISCVITTTVPLSPEDLGIDSTRLPQTGKVPIFRTGSRLTIHYTQSQALPNPAVGGSTIDCGQTLLARVYLEDAMGRRVPDDRIYPGQYVAYASLTPEQQAGYEWWQIREDGSVWLPSTTDLDAGTVELAAPLDLDGYTQPLTLYYTIEDSVLATSVDLSGYITVNRPIRHDFPADTTYVSSQAFIGDIWARYTNFFSQSTWNGVWSDERIGSGTSGQYNTVLYPPLVTNNGVIDERWRITFSSSTAFSVYGERSGFVATGSINADLFPANPSTGASYFFLDHRGWGVDGVGGWASGNTVRFNTIWPGAIWLARCVSPSLPTSTADSIGVVIRGDSAPA